MSVAQNKDDSVKVESMGKTQIEGAKDEVSTGELDKTKQSDNGKLKDGSSTSYVNYLSYAENNLITICVCN